MPSTATKVIIIEETDSVTPPGSDQAVSVTRQLTIEIGPGVSATEVGVIVARAISTKMQRS